MARLTRRLSVPSRFYKDELPRRALHNDLNDGAFGASLIADGDFDAPARQSRIGRFGSV
jgi:hypothetical protein